ncbi:hypothetical protein PHLCEN_2v13625 [Hermanssonia centrifuga]|uniref:Serine/threonine-protein kinase RIO1 n=1 Tax=Hermanssonia centrifuga TaxID=98765 RepID=A0A2R6NDN7_9APHY|nr:hypothetical protein PHLCEN_2v13625 [Hermanssonia centrifuga]
MPAKDNETPIEEGQFDDAPGDASNPTQDTTDIRAGHRYIDEEQENILEWSSESSGDEEELDEFDVREDDMEAAAFENLRAEDEDWEIAERDFTKQYNRLRQHVAVRTGIAQGTSSIVNGTTAVASLPAINRPRPAKQVVASGSSHTRDKTENQLQALSKYSSRLRNLDIPFNLGVGVNRKGPSATANMKDKSDRATTEQVLDPRTRIILFKMIGRGLLYEVNGCVSTGKEANVYHAVTPERKHLALKIYKTSILVFKDRDRYVSGEYRFRRGYSRHNPRKMVRVWAEKEMRNLKRLQGAGIRCPEPIEVRENVLVMSFIGDAEGWASPRLKDADVPASEFSILYSELLLMVRQLFHDCKLVHADLSEYNILYHVEHPPTTADDSQLPQPSDSLEPEKDNDQRGHLYIIDVSQSVEQDHPHAFDFLRSDLRNVEDFFSRHGIRCLGLRRAFEFVTKESHENEGGNVAALEKWLEESEKDDNDESTEASADVNRRSAADEDSVFMRSYIPRTLNEVYDPERDVGALNRGEGKGLIYKDTIGIIAPKEKDGDDDNGGERRVRFEDEKEQGSEDETSEASDDEEEEEDADDSDDRFENGKPRGHRHEDKDVKKERKKAVKAEAREKRKHKIPKAEKKRKVKTTARGK